MTSKREQSELEPKTAEQYHQAADAHAQTLKDFWKRFLVSGLFVMAAIIIILASLAWFVSNNRVTAETSTISAKGARYALTVSNAVSSDSSAHQGVYDAASGMTVVGAMLVNGASNFNNVTNGELGPGSAGVFDLQVQPLADDLGDVTVTLEFDKALKSTLSEDSARRIDELMKGHILLFAEPNGDAHSGQFYTTPLLSAGNVITIPSSMFDGASKKTVSLKVYWVWPEYFRNLISTGGSTYDGNLFAEEGSEGSDYWAFNSVLNKSRELFFRNTTSVAGIASIDNNLNNTQYATCANEYNAADDFIGSNVTYAKIFFSADESNAAQSEVRGS